MASTSKMMVGNDERKGVSFDPKGEENELYRQLWLQCAGPLVTIPRVGDKVFYFPQGHIEQILACTVKDSNVDLPIYNLPYKILCTVVDVKLKVEANMDEVFAQIDLLPQKKDTIPDEERPLSPPAENVSRCVSKKLSPTDATTYYGFSIPKRMADDCFPRLDMSLDPPSQELVAKDLHGFEWNFQHILRGNPKHPFINAGWSAFVNAKKLIAGDRCVFMRGATGELYVGVQTKRELINPSIPILSSQCIQHGILSGAFHAISSGTMFTVYYRPWTCPSDFLIPYNRYMRAAEIDYEVGTRFYMQFANHKLRAAVQGIITGIEDLDHMRWPDSEWRSLKVKWEDHVEAHVLPPRVSPWSIELLTSKRKKKPIPSISKRSRLFHPSIPFIVDNDCLKDMGEFPCSRHAGVLQGQEIVIAGASAQQSRPNAECGQVRVGSETKNGETEALGSQHDDDGKFKHFGVDLCDCASTNSNASPPGESQSAIHAQEDSNRNSINTSRGCTKVPKHGTALTRAVDLSTLKTYEELISELDKMFNFGGQLMNKSCGWLVAYIDDEGDTMLLGDYPWSEFRVIVREMFIQPKV